MAEALHSRQALNGRVAGACLALGPLLEQWGHMQVGGGLEWQASGAGVGEMGGSVVGDRRGRRRRTYNVCCIPASVLT